MSVSRPVHRGVQEQKQHVQKDNQRGCPRHALGDSLKLLRGRFRLVELELVEELFVLLLLLLLLLVRKGNTIFFFGDESMSRYIRLSFSDGEERISLRINLRNSFRKESSTSVPFLPLLCSGKRYASSFRAEQTPRELTVVALSSSSAAQNATLSLFSLSDFEVEKKASKNV